MTDVNSAKRKYNVMRQFRIDEISGVDNPAQKGARALICKRDPQPETKKMTKEDQDLLDAEKAKVTKLESELAVEKTMSGMSDVEKAHYSMLDEAGKVAFRAASADIRKTDIAKVSDSNPIVYKSDEGVEFRKSDDPRLAEFAKRLDAEAKIRKASDEKIARNALEKRAGDEIPNLPGDADVKCAVLKAVDAITDEKSREGALALLKAGNAAIKSAFDSKGASTAPAEGSPEAQLEALAKARAIEKKIDYFTAYTQVGNENQALLAKAVAKA